MSRAVEVVETGPLSSVQDLGRPGHSSLGVPESGALDAGSLRLANRLVGNDEGAAGIESTFGGLQLRFHGAAVVAITGAVVALHGDTRALCTNRPTYVSDGGTVRLGTPTAGARCYVAMRGGVRGERFLGSLSTDLLSGLGSPLQKGQRLEIGLEPPDPVPPVDVVPTPGWTEDRLVVRVVMGPRDDWFTPEAVRTLTESSWGVDSRSNRVGLRLVGQPLTRSVHVELPSEGVVRGAVQVPPNGQPVIFLNDHPVTGGYPVIAVALQDDLDSLGQCRPGQVIRFVRVRATYD